MKPEIIILLMIGAIVGILPFSRDKLLVSVVAIVSSAFVLALGISMLWNRTKRIINAAPRR